MTTSPKNSSRFDSFVIWANGFPYLDSIFKVLDNCFTVVFSEEISCDTAEELVNKVYAGDDVPLSHLQGKTAYLKNLLPKAIFVLVENPCHRDSIVGDPPFRHKQNDWIVRVKNHIRSFCNPQKDQHVIHGADYPEQTTRLMEEFFPGTAIHPPVVDVRSLLKWTDLPYVVLRRHKFFPMTAPGEDIDILCHSAHDFARRVESQINGRTYLTTSGTGWVHIDIASETGWIRLDICDRFDHHTLVRDTLKEFEFYHGIRVPNEKYDRITKGYEFEKNPHKKKYEPFLKDWHDFCCIRGV